MLLKLIGTHPLPEGGRSAGERGEHGAPEEAERALGVFLFLFLV